MDWFFKLPKKIAEITPPKLRENTKLPSSRSSVPDIKSSFVDIKSAFSFLTPEFEYEYIPVIRKLARGNSSVFRSINTLTELANPGIDIKFDSSVPPEQFRAMKQHIKKVTKYWAQGAPGLHGIINKMLFQIYIGGAISTEWVLRKDLKGVDYCAFINPERIRLVWDPQLQRYAYYQIPGAWVLNRTYNKSEIASGAVKLNPLTYKYFGLFTDEDVPIGNPPFISALDDVNGQLKMLRNIGFVTDQLGLMGFLEVLLNKPMQKDGEKDAAYVTRLETYLTQAKESIQGGIKDGVIAGFKDEHEFKFNSSTRDAKNVSDIFDINQRMVANGLLSPPQFLGGSSSGAETMIQIVFTMMLSQLSDIQAYVVENLEYGLWLELTLAGFKFNWLEVKFKKSTLTDSLKEAQTEEIKVRSSQSLYNQGIIGQEEFANRHGYDAPNKTKPRIPLNPVKQPMDPVTKEKKQDSDNKSNKKTRDKAKSQPNPDEKRGTKK